MNKQVLLIAGILAFSNISVAKEDTKAWVSKSKLKIGEKFTYNISITFSRKNLPQLISPEFKYFKVISQSSEQSYIFSRKGVRLRLRLIFHLIPVKEGEFILPSLIVKYRNKKIKTPKVKVKVERTYLPKDSSPGFLNKAITI